MINEPHRRYNPLTGRWNLVSPNRSNRPWSGQIESYGEERSPSFDPACYLCPGNHRAGGVENPEYPETFVFVNDFPALELDTQESFISAGPLMRAESQRGTCRVICFSPRHDLTLATMSPEEIRPVVELWVRETSELSSEYEWVQIFENRGETMGASSKHPHGQVWAGSSIPTEAALEDEKQTEFLRDHKARLLVDYAILELERQERIVAVNDHWLVLVPFWATWPYETLLLPLDPTERLDLLNTAQRSSLAMILSDLLSRYDNLFRQPFPYSMGWHGAPGRGSSPAWQLHAHFYPPLLRGNVQKFMVGYEMLAETQRDITPEQAADRLRSLSNVHYLFEEPAR